MPNSPDISERRRFIAAAGVLAAGTVANQNATSAALLVEAAAGASSPASSPLSASRLTASRFRTALNTGFQVTALSASAPPVALTLVGVTPAPHALLTTAEGAELSFSIDLAGAQGGLHQDTYAVLHPELGEFVALLVPSRDGKTLTGVFHTFG